MLTDPKWEKLEGGYRMPYDPRPVMSRLASEIEVAEGWQELWNELHHQGDVGEASYAAVTVLVDLYSSGRQPDWNLFSLSAIVEIERHRKGNPPLPQWLSEDYQTAWRKLTALAIAKLRVDEIDSDTLQSALAVVAIAPRRSEAWCDDQPFGFVRARRNSRTVSGLAGALWRKGQLTKPCS